MSIPLSQIITLRLTILTSSSGISKNALDVRTINAENIHDASFLREFSRKLRVSFSSSPDSYLPENFSHKYLLYHRHRNALAGEDLRQDECNEYEKTDVRCSGFITTFSSSKGYIVDVTLVDDIPVITLP